MPIPTNSRYEQSLVSSPSIYSTPSRSSHIRSAPSTSYSPTITSNGQPKLNVVTRIAIEGKAKQGQEGASIRMFLKICVPLDSVTPGSTIPLFPEENVKIHTSQVHPLDHNSVPYNFSSTISPLLHNAARALNLPARSQDNFVSVFNLERSNGTNGSPSMSRAFKSDNSESIPPIDVQYTGHIIVSGYSISFVLPKVFLSRRNNGGAGSDTEELPSRTPAGRRRASIGEKNQAQFMAAIDMWVPFMSKPPRSPYLLTIPTPRCLHNQIKLRIFPPANTATSFASLSSIEDDNTLWDLASEPHVTRSASHRPSRTYSYTHFADDESSDTSTTGMSEGCVVHGTFPSAEHIRIRWAKPMKNLNIAGQENSRRRVGVEVANGEMSCAVRGKGVSAANADVQGILMHVEYKAQCKGVWFPGVATLLGLDVGLEAKGSDIVWPKGYPTQWDVSGSSGYTGFDNGPAAISEPASRTSSMDSNVPQSHTASNGNQSAPFLSTRTSSSSTSSLLRAPLPAQNVADYSFEGSHATLPSASETLSSMSSLPTSSTPLLPEVRLPGHPVTLHLNMNELQPAVKNTFQFRISGTILITARATLARINGFNTSVNGDSSSDPEPVILPRFTVLAADSETTSIIVRSEAESTSVEVFHPTGDIYNDPQTRKTVLQKGGFTKCGENGGRIAIKTLDAFNMTTNTQMRPARPRTPSSTQRIASISVSRPSLPPRSEQAGSAILPWVKATVTALASGANMFPTGYAVRICLQTPALAESEWLEFGMAHGRKLNSVLATSEARPQPRVHIICAALDGVPVKAETVKVNKAESAAVPFEEMSGNVWLAWGKVYTGGSPGCNMVIDYIVKQDVAKETKGQPKPVDLLEMSLVLPTFLISIARLEVKIDILPGLEIASLHSNFDYHHTNIKGSRLLRYSLEEFSQPELTLMLRKGPAKPDLPTPGLKIYFILTWSILFIALCSLYRMYTDTQQLRQMFDGNVYGPQAIPTVTVSTTIYSDVMQQKPTQQLPPTPPLALPTSSTVFEARQDTIVITTTTTITTVLSVPTPSPATLQTTTHDPQTNHQITNDSELAVAIPYRQSILERFGLIPVHQLFFFEWAEGEGTTIQRTLAKVGGAAEVVWKIFRKVYHYPLDPP